ncbi:MULTISPECIES: mechanosensitive ion channel domain-containing protein [Halomonas]|uniref:Small-conductance mechanosensitive channel n=1 Tax=Halomonas litopenaei TaxID=2109328 RepID=A0ABX5J0W3_9GAMM|nr:MULTISPECIES: mechanosensitive ion channel domain-containing protein [Halomonas]MBR9771679.1 mechanosensitive ion channel [Gammaproteobacteria bacterium]KJZ17075.1 mechanosensitive ion channel protein [Halomonas sp. S2151]MAR72231.1 mechanosensitive ion channel protein [Halomonas sp.]MBR9881894.1 mechanosensitive ion channel [Gammaproteobacteria bacterium]MCJ8283828.1 mechanosensitive ion channel [Halomonas sp.]|tara:strand:+ start:874 stop:1731 length:858 start_codon:yes stop_codon:yes gene_type:complete
MEFLQKLDVEALIEFASTTGLQFLINLVAAAAIFIIGRWVAKAVHRVVVKGMQRADVEPLLVKFLGNILYALLLTFVILAAISRIGIQTASLIAVIGAAGLAVGLALQGSLANFAAGVMVIIFRPYRIGDYVEAGGVSGTVEDVQIISTELSTPDNRKIIVPNGQMMSGAVVNYSAHATRRVDLTVGVGYDDDIDTVRRVLESVVADDPRVLSEPAPNIRMNAMGDSSITWIVRPWVQASDYWDVYWEMTEEIKRRFDREGISIPFPQRDVHLYHHAKDEPQANA